MPLIGESAKDVANVIVGMSSTGLPQGLDARRLEVERSSLLDAQCSRAGQPAVGTGTAAGSANPLATDQGKRFPAGSLDEPVQNVPFRPPRHDTWPGKITEADIRRSAPGLSRASAGVSTHCCLSCCRSAECNGAGTAAVPRMSQQRQWGHCRMHQWCQ